MASERQKLGANTSDEKDEKSDEERGSGKERMRKAYDGDANLSAFGRGCAKWTGSASVLIASVSN